MLRFPLRWQLIGVLLLLLCLGLGGSAVVVPAALESYLVAQLDTRIMRAAVGMRRFTPGPSGRPHHPTPGSQLLPSDFVIQFRDVDGSEVSQQLRSPGADDLGEPELPPIRTAPKDEPFTVGPEGGGGHGWRVVVQEERDSDNFVVLATGLGEIERTVGQARRNVLGVGFVALVLLIGLGYLLVRRSFRPLEEVERTAEEIAALDLSRRVPVTHPNSEVGRLGTALNTMLGHIESAFRDRESSTAAARRSEDRMRRFVADASHELRSPLTSIRGYAELYRQGAVSERELPTTMRRIEDEAARMGLLVEDLLLLARLDQQRPVHREPVDLVTVAVDCVRDTRAVAGGRGIELDVRTADLVVSGDDAQLRQVLANLLNNAITHTPDETTVTVRLDVVERDGERFALMEVADDGPGLTEQQCDRVFERFYRASESRNRDSGGTGLGLSIVSALVTAHDGQVDVRSTPGRGTVFAVALPVIAPRQPPDVDRDRADVEPEIPVREGSGDPPDRDPAECDHPPTK